MRDPDDDDEGEVPEPTPEEEDEARESVKGWLKDQGYPSPDPEDQ